MSEIPDYLTPEIWLHNVFAAAEVRKGGVLKRKVRDVERLCGRDLFLAEARRRADDDGLTYVHGYDDPHIIAGQGTMGLEILEQAPKLDAVIVPMGALFREGDSWAAFVVEDGVARQRRIRLGRRSALEGQVLEGLDVGQRVVLYPSELIADGMLVEPRN